MSIASAGDKTVLANLFAGSTNEAKIQAAINYAASIGALFVYIPANMLPYSASLVTFNPSIRMIREGGDHSVYDVRAYGAKGDGVFNDTNKETIKDTTKSISTAFTHANVAGGGTVYFPLGTYLLNASDTTDTTLDIPSNVTVMLSPGCVLTHAPAETGIRHLLRISGATNVRIIGNGGILRGKKTTDIGNVIGLRVDGSTDVIIEGVLCEDFSYDGFYVGSGTTRFRFVNCIAKGCERNGMSIVGASHGIVLGGVFYGSGRGGFGIGDGIDLEPGEGGEAVEYISLVGVSCHTNDTNGIGFALAGAGVLRHCSIFSSHCSNNKANGIALNRVNHNTVSNNHCRENGANGITVQADDSRYSASYNVLMGNVCINNARNGIYLLKSGGAAGVDHNVISNNACIDNTQEGIVLGRAEYNSLVGNNCRSNGFVGIRLNTDETRFNTVSANIVHENGEDGILCQSAQNNNITGNSCFSNSQAADARYSNIRLTGNADNNNVQTNMCRHGGGADQARYGINIDAATCNTNIVTNNDLLLSGRTASLNDAGTGTVTVAGNRS